MRNLIYIPFLFIISCAARPIEISAVQIIGVRPDYQEILQQEKRKTYEKQKVVALMIINDQEGTLEYWDKYLAAEYNRGIVKGLEMAIK